MIVRLAALAPTSAWLVMGERADPLAQALLAAAPGSVALKPEQAHRVIGQPTTRRGQPNAAAVGIIA